MIARVQCIITSPMRRTVQTSLIGLDWLIKDGVPVECDAMWQEASSKWPGHRTAFTNSDRACDTGSDLELIASEFPELDFSQVDPAYPGKSSGSPYAFTRVANAARGAACLQSLYDRPEEVIAVVSHSGFLRTGISRRRYANADYRIFTFGRDAEGKLELVEDEETEKSKGAMGKSEEGIFEIVRKDFPPENLTAV